MSTINAVHVKDIDSCVTTTTPIRAGEVVSYHCSNGEVECVTAKQDIPIYHKIAITQVPKGEYVYKYGGKIGQTLEDIAPGDYVHVHNMKPVGFVEEA